MHGIGVSTVTAFTAHKEWATRPPDERFDTVHALYEAARTRRLRTEERHVAAVWERIPLAPDVELHVRRPLSRTAHKRVERLLTIAREILEDQT